MARTIAEIKAQIIAAKESQSDLDELTSTSQVSIWNLYCYIVAVLVQLHEQIIDIFQSDIETTVENNYVGTPKWIRTKCFEFQYSATNPQIVEINTDNSKISFPVINEALRIVTRTSVATDLNKVVNIKVAKSEPPIQLGVVENAALTAYLAELLPAGIRWNLINAVSDKLYIEGEVFYDGQYAAIIEDTVKDAIKTYLAGIDFNGLIKIVDLETSIKSVAGVSDIKLKNVWLRPDSIPLANGFKLIDTFTLVIISATPFAGYSVEEDTSGETWSDKITFTTI